jgi:ribonuclease P protein component
MTPRAAAPVAREPLTHSRSAERLGRLRKRAEFLRVAASGRKAAAPGMIVQIAAADATSPASDDVDVRLGITVSRKVGNAVARNRARRRLREAARAVLPRQAASGHDYVLIGRSETLTRPFLDLIADLEGALRRLGVRREPAE